MANEIEAKLTAADQTLAFTLSWFVAERMPARADQEMFVGVLGDVLPFVSEDHPIIRPMIGPSQGLIHAIQRGETGAGWAHLDAAQAIAKFARWRAGRSNEVFQKERGAGDGHS